jgi:RNA polymerase sigma-70 factor (ECF subfamily)
VHEREELRIEIRSAIDDLPENLREITILYYLEEMSIEDVCEVTGLGKENVKSRLFRARKKLRDSLEKVQPNTDNEGIEG